MCGAAHGLEAAPEISQSQRGEFISSFDTFSSAVSECNSYFMHLFIWLNWDREICSGRRVNFCVAQISDTMAPKTTTYRIPATAELSMRDCVKSPSQAAGGARRRDSRNLLQINMRFRVCMCMCMCLCSML